MENKFDEKNPNWFLENQEWWQEYSRLVRETGGEPSAEHFRAAVNAAPGKNLEKTAETSGKSTYYQGDLGKIYNTGSGQYAYAYAPEYAPGTKRFTGYNTPADGGYTGSGSGSGSYMMGSGSGSGSYMMGSGSGSGSYYRMGSGSGSGMNAYGLGLI